MEAARFFYGCVLSRLMRTVGSSEQIRTQVFVFYLAPASVQNGRNQLIVRPWLPYKVARFARQFGDIQHDSAEGIRRTNWLRYRGFLSRLLGERGQVGEPDPA